MDLLVVLLIVLSGVLINVIYNRKDIKETKVEHCRSHDWYSIIDTEGRDLGLMCIVCNFKAGDYNEF